MESQIAKKESKINLSSNSDVVTSPLLSTPLTLLAWCSSLNNEISVIDLETKQNYVTFEGASISDTDNMWTHVKEISNTKLLVSLHHNYLECANMEIFDISKKEKAHKIYSFGEVSGMIGCGDVTYNSRRSILGAIPVADKIAYHLFNVDTNSSSTKDIVKLNRKSKWHSQYSTLKYNRIAGFDFNPAGESIATMDRYGVCLISDVNINNYGFHLQVGSRDDDYSRCRWSPNTDESLLFVKYDSYMLNMLDLEKKVLTLKKPVKLDRFAWTNWIDVCPNNGNLLASGDCDDILKIFDKRESRIVKTFQGVHSFYIRCVRWNPSGDMIATASEDKTAKLLDFKTGKVLYTGTTSDGKGAMSVCFI